jgi:hypothetical protein
VPTAPSLSILIVHWNTCPDLRECLLSLQANPYTRGTQEIIVVDNGSTDNAANMVWQEFPQVALLGNAHNENYARATNQALKRATGDYLLLFNPDVKALPGSLDNLVAVLQELCADGKAGAVGAKLVYEDGRIQRSVRGFPTPANIFYDLVGLSRLFPRSRFGAYRLPVFHYDGEREPAPQPMASCFLLTRKAYERVGGMDERFPLYFNDVDWCKRASDVGVGIWYTSRAVFVHGWGKTTGRSPRVAQVARWESHRALLRYWHLHHYRKQEQNGYSALLRALLTFLVTLRAWVVTGRWGKSLGKNGGETTPESLRCELERAN